MKYNRTWLTEQENPDYLFFWGHQPSRDGSIIKTCMSQWWPAVFEEDGVVYKTAEHYMMAEKARLFEDPEMLEKILFKDSPKDAKELGRQVKNFDPEIWDAKKYEIVKRANYLKFSQDKALRSFLEQTKHKVIVEASPRDRIWGIGMGESNPAARDPTLWRGQNLLGFALMEVRDQLRE